MKLGFLKMCDNLTLLDSIIRKERTGNAAQISIKLGVTERCVYEYLELLKELDGDFKFNKLRNTYYYIDECTLDLKFVKINTFVDN